MERNLAWVPYTQLANITGRRSASLHRTADGLPMGVQFVGRLASEGLLLRLARQLERASPWAQHLPVELPRWAGARRPWPEGLEGSDTGVSRHHWGTDFDLFDPDMNPADWEAGGAFADE